MRQVCEPSSRFDGEVEAASVLASFNQALGAIEKMETIVDESAPALEVTRLSGGAGAGGQTAGDCGGSNSRPSKRQRPAKGEGEAFFAYIAVSCIAQLVCLIFEVGSIGRG